MAEGTSVNVNSAYYFTDESTDDGDQRSVDGPVQIGAVVMLSIFSVVGVVGNAVAFYIFFGRRTTSTSVTFILALAGTDCFTCLVTIPFTIVFELTRYNLGYDLACKTYMFLITSTVPFSAYIMVAIALDRYFCICHPFWFVFTIARAKAVIACMSIPAVTFGVITALSYGTYVYKWDIETTESTGTLIASKSKAIHHKIVTEIHPDVHLILGTTNMRNSSARWDIVPYGFCVSNTFIFSQQFLEVYKKIHAFNFLIAYMVVAVLYVLIYKSICTRRLNKARQKVRSLRETTDSKFKDIAQEETQVTYINDGDCYTYNYVDKLMRKSVTCSLKIVSMAKNDSSSAYKWETRHRSINLTTKSDLISEEHIDSENHTLYTSEENESLNNMSTQYTTFKTDGMVTYSEDKEEHVDGCGLSTESQAYKSEHSSYRRISCCYDSSKNANKVTLSSTLPSHSNTDKEFSSESTDNKATVIVMPSTSNENQFAALSPVMASTSLGLKPDLRGYIPTLKHDSSLTNGSRRRQSISRSAHTVTRANSLKRKRQRAVRDSTWMANMKTAFMLFIVTLVFTVAFLPALLMANEFIPLNLIIFYGHFVYNVANPFIYAFMNQTFRDEFKKITSVCRRRIE